MRWLAALLAVLILATGAANAADLAAEPVRKDDKSPFARCSYLNNIFLWGDPTDCPGDETVPLCTADNVLSAARRFMARAHPNYRDVAVKTLDHVREVPDHRANPSPLVRRYCTGRVLMANGDHTHAHFFIEEDRGFVGLSWAVSVCIDGYDKWRVYNGRCRIARPVTRY